MHDIKDIAIGGDVLLFLKGANDCVLYNTQIMVFSFLYIRIEKLQLTKSYIL